MESVLITQDLDPLPSGVKNNFSTSTQGILNSTYKSIARTHTISSQDNHIFSVRNRVKYQRLRNTTVSPDAFVKFFLFVVAALVVV